ncbi:hypothetical protein SD71_06680 [Cohnella kolymensis]|uniref:Uncharacterized protein n=1 Tax=Cohnella kolymensis TaxID=1590652 RepID=A0ABR5A6Z0_9BACL|nr:hypothetical protein [Cohnella kolymensis]KIL36682.1 hypothetical protein SD71_06680 [Cohnella kolymensis]
MAEVCNADIAPEKTQSFIGQLKKATQEQLASFEKIVNGEITRKQTVWDRRLNEMIVVQQTLGEIRLSMARMRQWRIDRRKQFI